MMLSPILFTFLLTAVCVNAFVKKGSVNNGTTLSCKNIPGDQDWPSLATWQRLNTTVNGRLIQTNPVAHVCHDPSYAQAECANVTDQWDEPGFMTSRPAEFLHPWFQNQTCVPFTEESQTCELGNYASYSINVSCVADIRAGLSFAQDNNIRLVIKNSGHDYYGKSTGKGALALWTHNLNSQEIISSYNSSYYSGPAIKAGAGVTGGQGAEFAAGHGYRLVVGTCPDVGFVGGFSQGGGHSLMTGLYGLGADQVLEWEVITASGEHVVATPTQNSDLYWALSGGGGGTYAIVISLTARVFEDGTISSATMSFGVATTGGVDNYWKAVGVFLSELLLLVENHGFVAVYEVTNDTLSVFSMMAPDHTATSLTEVLQPMKAALKEVSPGNLTMATQSLDMEIYTGDGYFDLYSTTLEPLVADGTLSPVMGGRFVTGDHVANTTQLEKVTAAMRAATENGTFWLDITALSTNSSVRQVDAIADNAVSAFFDDAFLSIIVGAAWDWARDWAETGTVQSDLMNRVMPALEAATPGTGAYLNEANWNQTNWQETFYGSKYQELRQIKNTYDPSNVFYGLTAVGSEAWTEDYEGRLCKTGL